MIYTKKKVNKISDDNYYKNDQIFYDSLLLNNNIKDAYTINTWLFYKRKNDPF